jgi:hypothetical protein
MEARVLLNPGRWLDFFTWGFTCLMYLVAHNIRRSRMGRAPMSIPESPLVAASTGTNISLYEAATFSERAVHWPVRPSFSSSLRTAYHHAFKRSWAW